MNAPSGVCGSRTGHRCFFDGNSIYCNRLDVVALLVSPQSVQFFSGYVTQQMPGQV